MKNALTLGRAVSLVPPPPVLGDWLSDFVSDLPGAVGGVWQAREQAEAAEERRKAEEARAAAAAAAARAAEAQARASQTNWTPYLVVGGAVLAAGGIAAYLLLKK